MESSRMILGIVNSKNAHCEFRARSRKSINSVPPSLKKTLFHEHLDARPSSANDDSVMEIACGRSDKGFSHGRYRRITQTSRKV